VAVDSVLAAPVAEPNFAAAGDIGNGLDTVDTDAAD
jgi:hypothetical protein